MFAVIIGRVGKALASGFATMVNDQKDEDIEIEDKSWHLPYLSATLRSVAFLHPDQCS